MDLKFVPVTEFGLEATAAVLEQGFSDYFVPISFAAPMLAARAEVDNVDFSLSHVLVPDGHAVGAALVACRGGEWRVAAMAVAPGSRGLGYGCALVENILEEAGRHGVKRVHLEVLQQNTPAVRLYESLGFRPIRSLVGFEGAIGVPENAGRAKGLVRLSEHEVAGALDALVPHDMPWQIASQSLRMTAAHSAWRLGGAVAVLRQKDAQHIGISSFAVNLSTPEDGISLLGALSQKFPGASWAVGAVFPEEFAPVFTGAGLSRSSLSQWQMVALL